ncbi:ciliogenesis and planar polarity effector 1 isoform X2 [Notolabrus celidotus]|uniref:ciliogenesis and planar polarity effector 1 isoform X2 n=1 Tax=Notolabrus celidotus TaxID=1203425 RepID=UPI00148F9C91|nr:ciliogenesis and planar polarity effector 1 isoform X2 [Notolabrus celidotus]
MELKLEVVLSSSIKRKKPWPRFCWLGKEKESVFLLDDKRISEINMVSGRTKKKTPKLHPLLNNVVTMTSSHNGMWLCGLMMSGELFLWNRDKDLLKTAAAVPEVVQMITDTQGTCSKGNATRLSLQVSGDGMRVLLVAVTGQVFLWECIDVKDLTGVRDGTVKGQWAHIQPLEDSILPSSQDKDASLHALFIRTEVMGDACLSAFVFTSAKKLIITCLKLQWEESRVRVGSVGYSIHWATKTYPLFHLTPPCQPVKSRGALVPAFSPDGCLLAIVLNQRQPKATQVLFVSTQNFVSISSSLGGCGSKKLDIPSKYIRSYWVGSVSWSPGGLFLACVLKRGSLLMLSRLGGLLTLSSSGCSVDFGPAHFLPLHPLVTYRPPASACNKEASLSSSSLSVRDVLRQRYSVTWHPRLLYLIVSDGYMATVMRVLDKPSPALLLKTLLRDTSRDLEKASQVLDKSQIHVRAWLESVSCLNVDNNSEVFSPNVTHWPIMADSVISVATDGSTVPLFLQDQGTLGGTKELLQKMQTFFEDDSDLDGPPAGPHTEDRGHLEFASMFDTLHALDTQTNTGLITSPDSEHDFSESERRTPLHHELGKIQSKLLTAWAFGMSLGNAVENRHRLLKYSLHCVVRFAALLRLAHKGKKNFSDPSCPLNLLKNLLCFLPWDGAHSDGQLCLGLMVELSKWLIRLMLTPHPDSHQTDLCQLSSHNLSSVLLILQLVSDSLDQTYSLQQRTFWSSEERESKPLQRWPSDAHHVPMLQEGKMEEPSLMDQPGPAPQRPSSRLLGVWQWVYKMTQQYVEDLKAFQGFDGLDEELHKVSVIMSQIQTAVQATGERLEDGPALLSYPGEHLFLFGAYKKSADSWRSQICEESHKSCDRSVFKETRLCLALLYSLLSEYRLREAQELGDHMAGLILHRAGDQMDNCTSAAANSLPCPWLPVDLHSEAARAVVQTLGRFMASYFANQPLYILPPHHVAVLPPLHLPHAPSVGRLVPLCQEEVAKAVRQQQLSEVWTVDYAQDLLLLGGLFPETVWLAYHLGDWKTAVSMSLAYTSYCTEHFDFTRFRRRELHLPTDLEPESIFQVELECLLSNKSDFQEQRDTDDDKSFTDPLEGEDWNLLQVSIQEILKASVMAGVNVLSSPLTSLLDAAKEMCSCLPALVPSGLYLPSPPLYCPQPSPNTQDSVGTMGHFAEVASRHKVSGVLQRLLMLLRSARCCRPAAEWYISSLRRARHILHKIKKTYSNPSAALEEKALPETLLKFISRRGFFRRGPQKDGRLDTDTIQAIVCFRELCALCWMLHVRDQLSICCRKYQAARQGAREEQVLNDSEVRSTCTDALQWARRLLPFSYFLNAEEILQDILLSLVSELPPLSLVADTLVRAFPEEEESVRVALREKYNSALQRLRQCNVQEGEEEDVSDLMIMVIQDKRRQRGKHLKRLKRHLAPPELHLWEKEEEEEDRGSKHGIAMLRQLSLGTTLSTSTLTDCGFPPVGSDGDTADTSEAISSEINDTAKIRGKRAKKVQGKKHAKKAAVKIDSVIQEESHPGEDKEIEQPQPPVVGTWEFELEDEEFLSFLELFLSYVLGKDSANEGESGGDLPLLKGFSSQLREQELHSLTFDVLTTARRRQRDSHHTARKHSGNDPPVFRAGCCYKPVKQGATPEKQTSSVLGEASISRTSVSSLPGLRAGRKEGLFGLRQQGSKAIDQRMKVRLLGHEASPDQSAFSTRQPPESFTFGSSTSVEAVTDLQRGLDPKLEAQFPELGRLLEWMVRWADKRVLLGHHGKKKRDSGGLTRGTTDEGVVIRVKTSAPAVLTSLSLLQQRFTALLGTDRHTAHIQIPEMQWTVAPVLQPEEERQLERESSVDTGYPGSANTPITGLDHNLQPGELSVGSCADEPEELAFSSTSLPNDQEELTFDAQQRPSTSQQLCLDDLDITPEKEGKSSESEGLEVSSSISNGKILGNTLLGNTLDTSLKLADLDLSDKAGDTSSSTTLPSQAGSLQAPPDPEPQAPPTAQPDAEVHAELSVTPEVLLSDSPVDPPSLQPQSFTTGGPTEASAAPNPPIPTEDPQMRQRLGEDLYRLVQNINYMSLMEVLGASFNNLQIAQQSSSLAQSNMNSSHPQVPSSYAGNFIPQQNAFPVQTTVSVTPQTQACVQNSVPKNHQFSQAPVHMFADQPAIHPPNGQHHITRNPASDIEYQEMQPLSVQAMSPEIQFRESRRLIPPSQGLLATSQAIHSSHLLPPSHENIQNDPPPQFPGLKLLRLHHCPQAAPLNPQTLHNSNPSKAKEKRQVFNRSHSPTPVIPQHNVQISERSREHEFLILPPAFPAHTPAPMQGLRLLHFEPHPQNSVAFPKIPVQSSFRSASVIAAPRAEAPIKLLHLDPGPKMMIPQAVSSAQMTRLMSMEELTKSVMARQNAEEAQLRLLKISLPPESTRSAATTLSSDSIKRQKRREKARKTEVTFKPNESPQVTVVTQEPLDEHEKKEPKAAEEILTGPSDKSGSDDSLLTGQRLLDRAMSTAAELHAFASTCKRPPECHDAFTNTEPASPLPLVDKAVSASVTAQSPKSQSSGPLQFFSQRLAQDTEEASLGLEENLDRGSRQFLSVLDLEDKSLHQDLPPCLSPGARDISSNYPFTSTSAQLHALATSVIRSAADPQPPVTTQEDFLNATTLTDIAEESPSCSHIELRREPERITLGDIEDPSDSEICQAIKRQSIKPPSSSSTPPTVWFSSRLSELDAQLAALQNIADFIEVDFSNTRMLVNTIEKLTPVLSPDAKTVTAVKKTVRLSVPHEAWTAQVNPSNEPSILEEEEEDLQEDDEVVYDDSLTPDRTPFFRYSASHDRNAGPSQLHTQPRIKDQLTGTSPGFADENLGQSELSDTAEILDELVKEGYLSLSDLDWSHPQPAHPTREQQQRGFVLQKRARPEDERRELRIWMRRKQREQLAVYQKQRASLREREHKPFSTSGSGKSTSNNRTITMRNREDKEKFMLLEQFNQRTREAFSLANDFPAAPPTIRSSSRTGVSPVPSATRSNSAPPPGSTFRVADDKISLKSVQALPNPRPWTAETQRWPSEDHRWRLGLHRPVTSLPKDRLSQVTRRGMLTHAKSKSKQQTSGQSVEQHVGHWRKTGLSKSPPRGTAVGRGILRDMRMEETAESNTWDGTTGLNRLLGPEESNRVGAELLDEQDDAARAGVLDMDWLDNLSETGSNISKIDWAAIERMVAAEDA